MSDHAQHIIPLTEMVMNGSMYWPGSLSLMRSMRNVRVVPPSKCGIGFSEPAAMDNKYCFHQNKQQQTSRLCLDRGTWRKLASCRLLVFVVVIIIAALSLCTLIRCVCEYMPPRTCWTGGAAGFCGESTLLEP